MKTSKGPERERFGESFDGVFLRVLPAAMAVLFLAGCEMDTAIHTTVATDGSVIRKIGMRLKGVERKNEAKTYPQKTFKLPAAPTWEVTEDVAGKLAATVSVKPGKPIPGGYERHLKCLDRTSKNTVQVLIRDHYLATSYTYEERFVGTVKADEFKAELLKQYDRVAAQNLAAAETEFGKTHDLSPVRKYLEKDLRKLFVSTANDVQRSGLFAVMATMVFRLAIGGYPIKSLQQLFEADPRESLRALFELSLRRMRLKPDRLLDVDEKLFQKHLEALAGGTVDQQIEAQKTLVGLGENILHRLDDAIRREKVKAKDAPSGAGTRISATADLIRKTLTKRMNALLDKLVSETEAYYLRPPADQKVEREKALARYLGSHIEANFAPLEYFFHCQAVLPGEMAWVDRRGRKSVDGSVRWNFSAVDFFIRDMVCQARSRVWKKKEIRELSQALLKDPDALTVKMREQLEDLFAALNEDDLKVVRERLVSCVDKKEKGPMEQLAKDTAVSKTASECAEKILKVLSTSPSVLP